MAGSWIKLRHDVLDAPEIRRAARATGLDCDQVLGKLARLWSWADRHGVNGLVKAAEIEDVDEQVGHVGFGAALVSVGWLAFNEIGVVIPNWERHFSDSAKARALGAARSERHRNASSVTHPPDRVTLGALPEKTRLEVPHPPRESFAKLRNAWNAGSGPEARRKPWKPDKAPDGAQERLSEAGWYEQAIEAMARLRACRYFSTPVTLPQFVGDGFVERVLGGQYDEPKAAQTAGKSAFEERRPPAEWNAADRAALAATLRREAEKASRAAI